MHSVVRDTKVQNVRRMTTLHYKNQSSVYRTVELIEKQCQSVACPRLDCYSELYVPRLSFTRNHTKAKRVFVDWEDNRTRYPYILWSSHPPWCIVLSTDSSLLPSSFSRSREWTGHLVNGIHNVIHHKMRDSFNDMGSMQMENSCQSSSVLGIRYFTWVTHLSSHPIRQRRPQATIRVNWQGWHQTNSRSHTTDCRLHQSFSYKQLLQ
jgi:hypothetical protein